MLDSHLGWTQEFTITLANGRSGRGSAPRGETLSIYEERPSQMPEALFLDIRSHLIGRSFTHAAFDQALQSKDERWGRRTTYALSMAFFYAVVDNPVPCVPTAKPPRLLFNLLNGGLHAYTNPVASDFPEFLLVPRHDDMRSSIDAYRAVLSVTKTALRRYPRRQIGENEVYNLGTDGNERAIEFTLEVLRRLGLTRDFGLMIDGSGGDLKNGDLYRLPVSGRSFSAREFAEYWLRLIRSYDLLMVEDPFAETDLESWQLLAEAKPTKCLLLGDNFTATKREQLAIKRRFIDGVLVKPDQNGTISGAVAFISSAREAGLTVISSHRSIESDSVFLSHLSSGLLVDMIKIGPFRDFAAIVKTNELLRRYP